MKAAGAALVRKEAVLSAVLQSTDNPVWTVDSRRFGLVMFNSAAKQESLAKLHVTIHGGMVPRDLLPPDAANWWTQLYRRVLKEGSVEAECQSVDGTSTYRVTLDRLFRRGKVFGISVFARDVTAGQRAEQAARTEEERYRDLVAASKDWGWEIDREGRVTFTSPQSSDILGYAPQELLGKLPFCTMRPEEAERVRRIVAGLMAEQKPIQNLESTCLHKAGYPVVLQTNAMPLIDAEGHLEGYRGINRDITTVKVMEEALSESERRLRLALESEDTCAFEWNPKDDQMVASPECAAVLGFEQPEVKTGRDFFNRVHPDDRSHYADLLAGLSPAQDRYRAQCRVVLPSGETRWIGIQGQGFFDSDGSLMRVVGIAGDITARKESEETLRSLSMCLVNAQEEERKRIARELHDAVSQELALISIEMTQVSQAAVETNIRPRLEALYARLQNVLSGISDLSHELHPSTLSHLGLSAAIRILCGQITRAYGIDVQFTDEDGCKLSSKETALCLYRVAQEALRNVVNHGHCKQAWVALRCGAGEVSLHIWDEGAGFDPDARQTGLGLISMRERLRLVGGRIVITSRPNSGTRIDAYVPINRAG